MTSFKPDPGWGRGSYAEDGPLPRHEFTVANDLHGFEFDEDAEAQLDCPDCDRFCVPSSLGEALDWALGHKCGTEARDEE